MSRFWVNMEAAGWLAVEIAKACRANDSSGLGAAGKVADHWRDGRPAAEVGEVSHGKRASYPRA